MNTLIHRFDLIPAVRLRDTVRGGTVSAEPRLAYGVMPLANAGDGMGDKRRAGFAGSTVRARRYSQVELMLAAGTPRPKGVVGWCPRSAPA